MTATEATAIVKALELLPAVTVHVWPPKDGRIVDLELHVDERAREFLLRAARENNCSKAQEFLNIVK